ncbi:DUF2064 domain-containing protein [Muricauda sp. JGD-17]|uniref:DUF2064 domain-containing protein n=1 Tax=Flagellimonas ochracea TaxID=2696472 RepID=A0A964TB48_9FLAO|nr:DUF2064 domain-containing protein [Allomuricauda ochracea]NAY91624.1 DUF2064 domain-containing protein [Allomuricauda ochracea]
MRTKPIQNTAVLIFANSAAKDCRDKKIIAETALFDTLTRHIIKTVKATGLPYFHFTENEQIGDTFGERFTNAITAVYDKGFENIVAIGNDSPELKSWHLRKAFQELQQGNTVLGPALDGGFYLMGIHRSHFDQLSFSKLPWQEVTLFTRTKKLLDEVGARLFRLPILKDLDSQKDIVLLANYIRSISYGVIVVLRRMLTVSTDIYSIVHIFLQDKQGYTHHNKGSPIPLFF